MIPERKFNSWNIERDIKQNNTVEFYSLPKDLQSELKRVSSEYNKLRENQNQQSRKTPEIMKNPLEKFRELIEKKIDSLV